MRSFNIEDSRVVINRSFLFIFDIINTHTYIYTKFNDVNLYELRMTLDEIKIGNCTYTF